MAAPAEEEEAALPAAYFSTDSPALQQLAMETFPGRLVTVEGDPVPSWARNKTQEQYAKVIADFEMLKLCDVIVGPVSSNYAKTAAIESMLTRGYLTQNGMCGFDSALSRMSGTQVPSLRHFEQKRGVAGMFTDCKPIDGG
jgi:hypothetical protein